jgi:hypothetical protein
VLTMSPMGASLSPAALHRPPDSSWLPPLPSQRHLERHRGGAAGPWRALEGWEWWCWASMRWGVGLSVLCWVHRDDPA